MASFRNNIGRLRKLHYGLDVLLTVVGLVAAGMVQRIMIGADPFIPPYQLVNYQHVLLILLILSTIIYLRGERYVYRLKTTRDIASEALTLTLYTGVLFLVANYILKFPVMPRSQFLSFLVLESAMLVVLRLAIMGILQHFRSKGYNVQKTLVVGTRERARKVVDTVLNQKQWGLQVTGLLSLDPVKILYRYRDIPLMGDLSELPRILKESHIDHVFFSVPSNRLDSIKEAMLTCERMGVMVCLQADFIDLTFSRYQATDFAGTPAIVYSREPELTAARMAKELLDRCAALAGLLVISPLMISIAALIKLTSRGPVFFKQERCGFHGKRFPVYKFRTMVPNAEQLRESLDDCNEMDGPVFKIKNDPRITSVGKVLRKLSLDELPQLINVVRGEMSLVGPRPPLPTEVREYDLWQRRKLSMKPGITCLWQVGDRNDSTFEQWMRQDLEYIDNWSLALDAKILLRTIPAVINGTGR